MLTVEIRIDRAAQCGQLVAKLCAGALASGFHFRCKYWGYYTAEEMLTSLFHPLLKVRFSMAHF